MKKLLIFSVTILMLPTWLYARGVRPLTTLLTDFDDRYAKRVGRIVDSGAHPLNPIRVKVELELMNLRGLILSSKKGPEGRNGSSIPFQEQEYKRAIAALKQERKKASQSRLPLRKNESSSSQKSTSSESFPWEKNFSFEACSNSQDNSETTSQGPSKSRSVSFSLSLDYFD